MHTCEVIKNTFKEDITVKYRGRYCLHKQSPSMGLTLSGRGGFPTKKFHPIASTRRAQLSVAVTTVRSTDLLKCQDLSQC